MEIKIATQDELDRIGESFFNDPGILPFLSTTQYNGRFIKSDDDWNGIELVADDLSGLLKIKIERQSGNGFFISLFAKNNITAGKLLKAMEKLITAYRPMYIETCVHESNVKSLKINNKRLGEPYGIDPLGAWNLQTGKWENLHLFKKIF